MAQTSINIRMDEELKRRFDECCNAMGMSMTTAFCVFAKTVVREQRIPFEVKAANDPFYSETNLERLRQSIAALEAGNGTVHELVEVEDE